MDYYDFNGGWEWFNRDTGRYTYSTPIYIVNNTYIVTEIKGMANTPDMRWSIIALPERLTLNDEKEKSTTGIGVGDDCFDLFIFESKNVVYFNIWKHG